MNIFTAAKAVFFKPACGNSDFDMKTRIARSSAVLAPNASECFLDRLAASPSALVGALVASGVWAVVVLYWGL